MESCNEKATITMKTEKNINTKDDFTLVELSPEETLVEFSPDSSADPSSWIFVSYIMFTIHVTRTRCTNRHLIEQENVQRSRGAVSRTQ